ncbi:MAG: ABC transporter ATP-binding protein [Thermoanaerobaculaceae bacterium]|jgi:ABC-2 type transport system ATP-binding protein|nr:ABC transporter ATP-binding protein [Thermoanaerobaculaceae bacterium]
MTDHASISSSVAGFDRVTVRYGPLLAADAVTLSVPRGCVYALLGRNGAGKSSLVRCLLGQQKPTAGTALLFGKDAWRTRRSAMQRVGVVPEEPDVPPAMTAAQTVAFCSRLYERWDGTGVAERLRRFDVPTRVPVGRLSKGQKGQLALALALGPQPDLLVLDDPTLGLDVVARKDFYEELVGDLADRGTTVFITTHDLAGVEGIAERVGMLRHGTLVLDEDMEALKARFRRIRFGRRPAAQPAADEALGALGAVRVAGGDWGFEAVVERFGEEPYERFTSEGGVVDPEARAMSLEEIFIAVCGEERGGAS